MKQTVELCLRNRNKIAAIVPYRKTDGETGTVVHFTNGTHALLPGRRCKWLAEHLAGYHSTTLKDASQKSSSILGEGALKKPPLWLSHDICLVQAKFPTDTGRYSSTIGYIVVQKILIVEECEGGSRIKLRGKCPDIISCQRKRSIEQQRQLARKLIEIHYRYRMRHLNQRAESDEGPLMPPAPFMEFELTHDTYDDYEDYDYDDYL